MTAQTLTAEQFDALPEEEIRKWELLDGEFIEVPSATPRHNTNQTYLKFRGFQLSAVSFMSRGDASASTNYDEIKVGQALPPGASACLVAIAKRSGRRVFPTM